MELTRLTDCEPGYLDWSDDNPHADKLFREALDSLSLGPVFDLALGGLDNARRGELLFKKARTAGVLGLRGAAGPYKQAGDAHHRRSLRQLRGALDHVHLVEAQLSDTYAATAQQIDDALARNWRTVYTREVLPDFRLRLLEDDLAPGEVRLIHDALSRGPKDATVSGLLSELGDALGRLTDVRAQADRGATADDDSDIPGWKEIGVEVAVILIWIGIAVCMTFLFILCLIISIVWRAIQVKVVRKIMADCRDPNPT